MMRRRRGFALAMTLWALTVIAVAGLAVVLSGREAFDVARNRYASERSYWRAEGCLSLARAEIDEVLASASSQPARTRAWRALDTLVDLAALRDFNCDVQLRAAGDRLDVNSATDEELRKALDELAGSDRAGDLLDALLDWRDADDVARPGGAEADWYVAQHRHAPRNGAFASVDEMRRVRGFEHIDGLGDVFTTEAGRISLPNAPAEVLSTVPGLTAQSVARIIEYRNDGHAIEDLVGLSGILAPSDVDSLMIRYADLSRAVVLEPDAWIVSATASDGVPPVSETSQVRLIRKGDRAVVVRRRTRL